MLPAIIVMRHADLATHFVVVWKRHGPWLQIMDPALGRRWIRARDFRDEVFRHEMSVEAPEWRIWAGSHECLAPLAARLDALKVSADDAAAMIHEALADPEWFSMGAFDATVRLVQSLVHAGGVKAGGEAARLVSAIFRDTIANGDNINSIIPPAYWSVMPDASNTDPSREMLRVSGAVVLKIVGMASPVAAAQQPLPAELAAALNEQPEAPLGALWAMLKADGLVAPLALAAAIAVSTGALMLEALLFRGLLDMATILALPIQRLLALIGLLGFVGMLITMDLAIGHEVMRQGRQLEARLRMALLAKLPRLNDRYFQSRPITDMADRSHNIAMVRMVPGLGLQFVQAMFDLVLTFAGILLIAPDTWALAAVLVLMAVAVPALIQPLLNERDLRVRNHAGALHGFYLDAMLGLAPIRAHGAQRNVQRQHESLLVEWALSLRGWVVLALASDGVQGLLCSGLAGLTIISHFAHTGRVSGADLLLIFWVLKLPATGGRIAGLAHQYPAQRNSVMRLLEPLNAPEEMRPKAAAIPSSTDTVSISIERGQVRAAGHDILRDITLSIAPGEHVAVVGKSGAGKSSLIGLLLGWHSLAEGMLTIDGAVIDQNGIEALRQKTAWVDPAIQIWNRSLLDNLTYALDGRELDRIGELIEASGLRGVTRRLPQGLQTLLGEGGGLLSGGEGQRVRLARALLMPDVRLALLDEPFRGLDREQRRSRLAEARNWWRDVTMICVTHDITETRDFDRVLVVEDGRIVEDGAPDELVARASRYRELLDVDGKLSANGWQGPQWRHISMVDGKPVEQPRAKARIAA